MKVFRKWHVLAVASCALMSIVPTAYSKDITLTYSDWQLAQDVWGKSLDLVIDQFQKDNPGVTVKRVPVPLGQRDVKYTTAIRAGQGPDVFALDVNPVREYISKGWVLDLSSYIDKAGDKNYLKDFYPVSLEPVTVGGKIYGIPMNTVAMTLLYNQRMFNKAGIEEAPKTWKQLRADAKKLTGANQWGMSLVLAPAGFDLRVSSILRGFGADYLTADGKKSALDTPQAKEAFDYILDLIKVDKSVPPGVTQVDANGARRLMANQTVAMLISTTWGYPEISAMNPKLDGWHTMKMAPIPQQEGNTNKIRTVLYQKSLFVNSNTKHPEEAWKLAKYLTDAKSMKVWFDSNNMLSSRRSVNENYKNIVDSPSAKIVADEIDHGAFLPLTPKWPQIMEAFRQNLQDAIVGSKTREQALSDANSQINKILQQ
ncbi:MAG: sugar ABC transporter substrate-binding protein [Paralcaligenes sp.]